jgi:lipoprotein NlpD
VIRVGQVLRLAAPGTTADPNAPVTAQEVAPGVTTAPLRAPPAVVAAAPPSSAATAPAAAPAASAANASNLKTSPKAIKEPYSDQAVRELTLAASAVPAPREPLVTAPAAGPRVEPKPEPKEPKPEPKPATPAPATAGDSDQLDWAWPAKGKVVAGFSETANLKGIDIAGTAGQTVAASAAGRVVYAGTGLRGYGKLIIIKHNATFLSAYAHNREILVKEGQQVARGQKIAEMGSTDADQVKLHFEIRRQGKPMDPAKYLPPA